MRGGCAVDGGGVAVLVALLLDGSHANVVGAVVVAGQEVAIVLAEARVVVGFAAVELALDGGLARLQDAGIRLATGQLVGIANALLGVAGAGRPSGRARACGGGGGLSSSHGSESCNNSDVLHCVGG